MKKMVKIGIGLALLTGAFYGAYRYLSRLSYPTAVDPDPTWPPVISIPDPTPEAVDGASEEVL